MPCLPVIASAAARTPAGVRGRRWPSQRPERLEILERREVFIVPRLRARPRVQVNRLLQPRQRCVNVPAARLDSREQVGRQVLPGIVGEDVFREAFGLSIVAVVECQRRRRETLFARGWRHGPAAERSIAQIQIHARTIEQRSLSGL
jgi:hypothetical protein